MTMSKKHYCAIVAAKLETVASMPSLDTIERLAVECAFEEFAKRLAVMLKRDNPNFDRTRFLDAMRTESSK